MIRSRRAHLGAVALVVIGAVVALGAPGAHAADADIVITGGASSSEVVCGNVAAAQAYAQRHQARIQRTDCRALANGGDVAIDGLVVTVSRQAAARNRNDVVLRALSARSPFAQDDCSRHRRSPGPGVQLNRCRATGRGGMVNVENVKLVTHGGDGKTTTRQIDWARIPSAARGAGAADCRPVKASGVDQQDDCTSGGTGASWVLHGVDVQLGSGTISSRNGVDINLRGGSASAVVRCFNVADGSSHVIQINKCSAEANGGDATVRNTTIHVYT